ncbi:MAG: glycosyltransferase family 39 protein [bacterium]|nr:glycosyltransferase family 39 protein [bacterium]
MQNKSIFFFEKIKKNLENLLQKDLAGSAIISLIKVIATLPLLGWPNYHNDELQFITYARHLALGYVDDCPFLIWMQALAEPLFGYSPQALRIFPLVSAGLAVYAAGCACKAMGGSPKAQMLASLAIASSPLSIYTSLHLTVAGYELCFWLGSLTIVCQILRQNTISNQQSIKLGLLLGLAALNKLSTLFLATCFMIALLFTDKRHFLKEKKLYSSLGIMVLCTLPSFIWWYQHEWSGIEFLLSCAQDKLDTAAFIISQLAYLNIITAAFSATGFLALLFSPSFRQFKALGIACFIYGQAMILCHGQARYFTAFLAFMAVAGTAYVEISCNQSTEKQLLQKSNYKKILRALCFTAAPAFLAAFFVICQISFAFVGTEHCRKTSFMDVALRIIGGSPDIAQSILEELTPPDWQQRIAIISKVYAGLNEKEKSQAALFTIDNGLYGMAAISDFPLPDIICNRYSCYYWPLPGKDIDIVIGALYRYQEEEKLCKIFSAKQTLVFPIYSAQGTLLENFKVTIWSGAAKPGAFNENWASFKYITRL